MPETRYWRVESYEHSQLQKREYDPVEVSDAQLAKENAKNEMKKIKDIPEDQIKQKDIAHYLQAREEFESIDEPMPLEGLISVDEKEAEERG